VAIALGTADVVPMSIAFLGAAILTLLTGCIGIDEAHEFIDWRLLILIGGMTAFGTAMDDRHTGAAGFLARAIVDGMSPLASSQQSDAGPARIRAADGVRRSPCRTRLRRSSCCPSHCKRRTLSA
jgi:hypothetical protein